MQKWTNARNLAVVKEVLDVYASCSAHLRDDGSIGQDAVTEHLRTVSKARYLSAQMPLCKIVHAHGRIASAP